MPWSLRSTLTLASVLWTAGLLMLMHLISLTLVHTIPLRTSSQHNTFVMTSLLLMAGGVVGVRKALKNFRDLRDRLLSVHAGRRRRIEGSYPSEIQPLIDDLNALLESREKAVERAIATAGDLAHGLKTPLALLAHEAERASAVGNVELADSIVQQVDRMSRQVNYHLARARASASGTAGAGRCPVAGPVEALIRAISKLHAGRGLQISSQIGPAFCVRVQRQDLDEMLGNLLDNASKWAKSKIEVNAALDGAALSLTVDDDGPGLAPALRTVVLQRGVRLDEAAQGSGLGLAIVGDLAEIYGGDVTLEESPLGGLRARLSLPSC